MTCIEKLKELNPTLDDKILDVITKVGCPGQFKIMDDPKWCDSQNPDICAECWNRCIDSTDIPREFEYQFNEYYKAHITVLERHEHRYQGYVIYKVYREIEDGSFGVKWFNEVEMRNMLKMRVE